MTFAKGNRYAGPIRGMGPVRRHLRAFEDGCRRVQSLQALKRSRIKSPRMDNDEKEPGPWGVTLRSHHEKLAREGYVPPPPVEVPLTYYGKRGGARSLTDEQVIAARRDAPTVSVTELAKRYGVKWAVMWNAVKGITYRHLNWTRTPQI